MNYFKKLFIVLCSTLSFLNASTVTIHYNPTSLKSRPLKIQFYKFKWEAEILREGKNTFDFVTIKSIEIFLPLSEKTITFKSICPPELREAASDKYTHIEGDLTLYLDEHGIKENCQPYFAGYTYKQRYN